MIGRVAIPSLLLAVAVAAGAQSLALARSAARQGNVDTALAQAQQVVAGNPRSAEAHTLLCKLYGSIDQLEEAVHECEAARDLQPGSSDVVLDLARAYGARADHAGALTGMRMVGRIRENFEKAVQLNGKSVDALSDLGEFYVSAPGVVGGGLDKARSLVPKMQAVSPARAHRLAGMIAAKAGDAETAEAEFKQQYAAGHSPEAYVDLANFYRKRKQWDQSAENAAKAIAVDTKHGPDTLDAARILLEEKRSLPFAQKALHEYLGSPQESAVMYAASAHVLLGQSLDASGDKAAAQAEYQAAHGLAKDYAAARKALR